MTASDAPSLAGKSAVVTGAASGIGREIALTFAAAGARVACVDRDAAGAAATVSQIDARGGSGVGVCADISDPEAVQSTFAVLDDRLPAIDVLVNNASVVSHEQPEHLEVDEWSKVMAVNAAGSFHCAQAAGRRMIAQHAGGVIVNISSIAGSSALGRGNVAYSASKGAIDALTRELAIEWAPYGIRVNAIKPAQVMTPALQALVADPSFDSDSVTASWLRGIPLGRLPEAEDVAAAALFLVSDQARMITGVLLPVDGGNLAFNAGGTVSR